MDAYRSDLAFIHDSGYGAVARAGADRLLSELASRNIPQGQVVDLGCGSGILAESVSRAGYDVLGVDISKAMIDLARRRAPNARFQCAPLLSAELPECVAVTSTGEALNYLFDPTNTAAALSGLFGRIHQALAPGGILLFDAAGPARRTANRAQRFTLSSEWATLVETLDERDPTLLVRHIITFRKDGSGYRRDEETHRQKLYGRTELANMLRNAGFRVRFLSGYGSEPFARGDFGVLARKPGRQ